MNATYRILENEPYDTSAPITFWIIKEWRTWLGFKRSCLIGKYNFDSGGSIGEMPFFSRQEAEEYINGKIYGYTI